MVNRLLEAAQEHGLEDPEMEVGDLQSLFMTAWNLLTLEQKKEFFNDEDIQDLVTSTPEYEDIARDIYLVEG